MCMQKPKRMGVTIGNRHYSSFEQVPTDLGMSPVILCRDCVDAGCSQTGNPDGGCRAGRIMGVA